ncbi:MAG: hypothetical protein WCG97_00440 [bacterium]
MKNITRSAFRRQERNKGIVAIAATFVIALIIAAFAFVVWAHTENPDNWKAEAKLGMKRQQAARFVVETLREVRMFQQELSAEKKITVAKALAEVKEGLADINNPPSRLTTERLRKSLANIRIYEHPVFEELLEESGADWLPTIRECLLGVSTHREVKLIVQSAEIE